jgi:hypothetical protein
MKYYNDKIPKFHAVHTLVGGGISGEGDNFIYHDGQIPPTGAEIDAKLAELQAEYDAQKYARNRKSEYDALNQFELMTDDAANSTTTHADAIEAVKTKWPKDNSGPIE